MTKSVKEAISRIAQLQSIERNVLRVMLRGITALINRAAREQLTFAATSSDVLPLQRALVEALLNAHVASLARSQSAVINNELRLAALTTRQFAKLTPTDIEVLRSRYNSEVAIMLSKLSTDLTTSTRNAVQKAVESGVHPKTAVKAYFKTSGIAKPEYSRLLTIVRTQLSLVYSAASKDALDRQEAVWGYEYVTVGDARVRSEHLKLEGVKLPKDHAFWRTNFPPNGWNCRCQAIPIFDRVKVVLPPDDFTPDANFALDPSNVQLQPLRSRET